VALAWCARLFATAPDADIFGRAINAARALGHCNEIEVAEAFRVSVRDKTEALALLQKVATPLGRSASFIVVARAEPPDAALSWFEQTGLDINALDPDGKFVLLQKHFEADRWAGALKIAGELGEKDFLEAPVLLLAAANAHLAQAVPDQLRISVLQQLPLEASSFPLGDDGLSLNHRRAAQQLYERVVPIIFDLNCEEVARLTSDRVLWLKLRDPNTINDARAQLARSMRPPIQLRRVPLALQFGLKLDLRSVETEIDQQAALSGGKSIDVALARFSFAFTKSTAQETAEYLAKHRPQWSNASIPKWWGLLRCRCLRSQDKR
jgi:hypothetical protein